MSREIEPVMITGKVRHFKGNGRKLGYPTANLKTGTNLPDGVFFGFADLADFSARPALVFIGTPTTMGDSGRRVEAHLLDITDRDYYGEELRLRICRRHRSNQTFGSIDLLTKAMRADEAAARRWFAKNSAADWA